MKYASALIIVCVLCTGTMGQKAPKVAALRPDGQPKVVRQDQQTIPDDYIIGPEDVLSIAVAHEPDLTNKVTVRPDGKIGVGLLNDVQASGLTPKQLQERITDGLKQFVTVPQVSVIVQEIRSPIVFATGAVSRPGVYQLGRPTSVMELLIRAGGLSEFAKADDIQVLRKEAGKTYRFRFNYKQFVDGSNYAQDIPLRSGDMVIVP
jgi:polysaccharide biosynthesis/export protein